MQSYPSVSIIITNFNREKTIGKAIESALAQDYENLEIIISDNCSTDNSHEIITKYTSDTRIKYYKNETNIGMLGNFKICFEERAKGEYITIVNSDDRLINPQFVSQSINLINKYDNVVIVKSDSKFVNKNVIKIETNENYYEFYKNIDFFKIINFENDFGWSGILLKKAIINSFKLFDKEITAMDYIANLKVLKYGNICFNRNVSYEFYINENNASNFCYDLSQIQKIILELKLIFENLSKILHENEYYSVIDRFKYFYTKSFYQSIYKFDRENINECQKILNKFDTEVFMKFKKSKENKLFEILYFFPKVGDFITRIKKSIYEKKII